MGQLLLHPSVDVALQKDRQALRSLSCALHELSASYQSLQLSLLRRVLHLEAFRQDATADDFDALVETLRRMRARMAAKYGNEFPSMQADTQMAELETALLRLREREGTS